MTEQTIFESDKDQTSTVVTPTSITAVETPITPNIPPELEGLVGDDKKYKSVSDAMKAIPHAQQHISTLEEENARMKEDLSKRKTAEELLEDIRNSNQPVTQTASPASIDTNTISDIVKQQLANTKTEEIQASNTTSVVSAFRENFGEKAEELYNKIADDNGMTLQEINLLSMKNPKVVLHLAGITHKQNKTSAIFSSDVNTQALPVNRNIPPETSKVVNYGSSKDLADAMRRSREIVDKRLNITR